MTTATDSWDKCVGDGGSLFFPMTEWSFAVFDWQLLAKIYKMPSKPVFLGARLASLPMRLQERSVSSEDGMDCVLQEFDDDTGKDCLLSFLLSLNYNLLFCLCGSSSVSSDVCSALTVTQPCVILCPAGLIQVWILLLEQLTAAVSNCPRQHQPPTLELLFTLLREVTNVPGNTHTLQNCRTHH